MNALEVEDLVKSYSGFLAVNGVSFSVKRGEMLALIGPNGAGKTTCFNMINGQIAPTRGHVRLFGRSIEGLAPHRIARLGVARTFQIAATFGSMTLAENVQMALLTRNGEIWPTPRWAARRRRDEALAGLNQVGLADQADKLSAEIAYGDVKRLELAIALANQPRLLLMDEPAAGMAPSERRALMSLTEKIARERGIGVLFTEHDMDIVFGHADRLIVLNRGELIAEGAPAEVRAREDVRTIYLGAGYLHEATK
jgi:ABC-type branched-subunit amino acid transport system ATPase component